MGTATHFAGIDVSKDTLDACLLGPDGRTRGDRFANDATGHAALAAWADRHAAGAAVHYCMEATGPYSEGVAAHLHAAGRLVSVANPARVKAHMRACGQGNKTDPADARAIATFARDREPRAWLPPSPEVGRLQALVRRHADVVELAAREKGRLASPALAPDERKSVARTARFLEREAGKLRAAADALVAATPALAADRGLLESIPGVGRQTATAILAGPPAVERRRGTAGWPRPSSGPARACGSGRGCRRPGTRGRGRRCSCRPRRPSGSTRSSGRSTPGWSRPGRRRRQRSGRACGSWS